MAKRGAWWRRGWEFGKEVWTAFARDRGPLAASAVAFFLLLSILPLMLFLFSVAAFFVTPAQIDRMAQALIATLGEGVGEAMREQLLLVVRARGVLTGISVLFGLWAGSQIFVIIEAAMNQVWGVKEGRPFWIRYGLALLMVFVTGLLGLLAVGVVYLVRILEELNIPLLGFQVGQIPWLLSLVFYLVLPLLFISIAFGLIYRYLSARKIAWSTVWPGALAAGAVWVAVLQVFSWYTANFANYATLYGSLGGLVLLMLWFNYSAQIMLLGAEISAAIHHRKAQAGKVQPWKRAA